MKYWLVTLSISVGVGCAQHHCRRAPETMAANPDKSAAAKVDVASDTARRVKVYKYDGSLQCGQGKVISIEKMMMGLKDITVYSSTKKPDGLMHIQVCGSNTGMANVFEISESDLTKAESLGFKKWTFE